VFGLTQFDLASIARVLTCFGVDGFVSLGVNLVLELDLASFETVLLFPLLKESEKKSPFHVLLTHIFILATFPFSGSPSSFSYSGFTCTSRNHSRKLLS
jgi:hypothetical protein